MDTPTSTPDTAYFHSVYKLFGPDAVQREPGDAGQRPSKAVYHVTDRKYAFTLATIMGKHITLEGNPTVGKTTFLYSLAAAIKRYGGLAQVHEETPDAEMLHQFFLDPPKNAFWFQMFKLRGRMMRAQMNEDSLRNGTRGTRTNIEDRDLPGDMAFALYNHYKGFISDEQLRIYFREATLVKYHAPFLSLLLTASPPRLVGRVKTRGNAGEIEHYDEDYFVVMDACNRAALEICGCNYYVVDWDENIPGIGAPGAWHNSRTLVSPEKCMDVIEHAIAAIYGDNIARINAMHESGAFVLHTDRPSPLRENELDTLVERSKELILKYSSDSLRTDSDTDDDAVAAFAMDKTNKQ